MSPKFRECYQIGLWQNADQKGSVRVVIDIDANGHPAKVTLGGGDGLDKMVLDCLVAVVRRESFAPPAGGSGTVTIPLNFGSDQN
jgi:TonB family protein